MIKVIILLILLFVGLFFGHHLIGVEGRVIIALPKTVYEMNIISSLIIYTLSIVLIWLTVWLILKLLRSISGTKNWLGLFSKRQQNNAYYKTINAMLMNEQNEARKLIQKTFGGDFQGSNYLIAAQLERQANNNTQAQAYLIQAMDDPKSEPLAIMQQAEIALSQNDAKAAMEQLSKVEGKVRKTKAFVLLKLNILESLGDWQQIQQLATDNKRLLGDDYIPWAEQCVKGEFATIASKRGAKALQTHWETLSRKAKSDQANQNAYVQLLIDQGLYTEAEEVLVKFASKHAHASQLDLFKQIVLPNPSKALRYIESEIKNKPEDATLYSALAQLAFNSQDFDLAEKAVTKALDLKPSDDDNALYAKLLEKSHDFEKANKVYQGLLN